MLSAIVRSVWEKGKCCTASDPTDFSSSPKLSQVFLERDRNTEYNCSLFLLENIATKKRKMLWLTLIMKM